MNGVQRSVEASGRTSLSELKFTRKEAVSTIAAAITFGLSQSSAFAEEKAACTYASCPPPPADAVYELSLFQVPPSKFTGKGYSYSRPSDTFFKRVTSPASLAVPGSVLFRDKRDADTAVFSDVQEVPGALLSWKPTLVDQYKQKFGDKFQLVRQEGPAKRGGADYYTVEYVVETVIAGQKAKVHFVSGFAAGADNVYVINAQAKEENFAAVGATLREVVKSFRVNE